MSLRPEDATLMPDGLKPRIVTGLAGEVSQLRRRCQSRESAGRRVYGEAARGEAGRPRFVSPLRVKPAEVRLTPR